MIIFIKDIIAQSYLYNAKDKDAEIAQFFFEAQSESKHLKRYFYVELISGIESLIRNTYSKVPNRRHFDPKNISPELMDEYHSNIDEYDSYVNNLREEHQNLLDLHETNYILETPNWEECTDADKLTEAMNNKGVVLKDPIVIIDPSKDFSPKPLVLRKSKLEYLKEEATRAKNAKNINELDTATSDLPVENKVSKTPLDIKKMVIDAFAFTRKEDPRSKKVVLSEDDFNNLVIWVTHYFENEFKLHDNIIPIKNVNTGKGNIRYTFKILFDDIHPELSNNRGNLNELASRCFHKLSKDKKGALAQTSEPTYYNSLVGKSK